MKCHICSWYTPESGCDHYEPEIKSVKKTPEEVEALKKSWLYDPCWDIHATEGFEAHEEELKQFQKETEARWKERRQVELKKKAEGMGIDPENTKLMNYIVKLESTIEVLERRIEKLEQL